MLVLAFACGCQGSASKSKNKPQVLRTCLGSDVLSLDPRKGVSMGSQSVVRMLFMGLVRLNQQLDPELELAESYHISNDNKTYVFTIKKCQWSDGSPITAYDFEQTWKMALTPGYSSACTNLFFYIKNGRKAFLGETPVDELGVKALDDRTLAVELENPTAHFLNILINSVFSPVHESMRSTPPDTLNLVCSGPFRLKKHLFQDQIVLEKNSRYWNAQNVKLDELHYYIVKDSATSLMMFEKKEIDWLGEPLSRIANDSIPDLKAKGMLHTFPTAGLQWMFLNTNKLPLNNANIRKALAYAIDRRMIMQEHLYMENTSPTLGLIPKIAKKEHWHPWFVDNDLQNAKALFSKGLEELSLSLDQFPAITIVFYGGSPNDKTVQIIQQMWRKNLGITVNIEQLDGPILFSRWYARDYQILWMGWILQYNDPANMLEVFKHKNAQPNYTGWENAEFIQHTNASFSAPSETERWDNLDAAEKIFCDEMPSIPVNDLDGFYLAHPYIKDVFVNPLFQVDFDRASIDSQP